MRAGHPTSLALIVQSTPYQNREARADVDIALAAVALDFTIRVYFQGSSVMQLVDRRNPSDALLPKGYRAWAALPELGDVQIFAERQWLDFCREQKLELLLPVEALGETELKRSWRSCNHVMVL
jgi:sulfur relay (sulfurtransferase) DsrF/TusC family protein